MDILSVAKTFYGVLPDGKEIFSFEIKNGIMSASVLTLGAILDKLLVRDAKGNFIDVLLGFDDLKGHLNRSDYHGVTVGQYCNRIKGGQFTLNGKKHNVTRNEKGITCLHGAGEYSNAIWNGEAIDDKSVSFTYFSPDMTNGFPGNVENKVIYTLSDDGSLIIEYESVPDSQTVINLTNHAYFNLNGYGSGTILNHLLTLNADCYTPIDKNSIPTGKLEDVKGSPFSFVESKNIGKDIEKDDLQLKNGQGYDHNFCIRGYDGTLQTAAVVRSDQSGIELTVKTTLPGIQFYTGNFLSGVIGKSGLPMDRRTGFCLETQFYPDTPNNPAFPSCVFTREDPYSSVTVFSFANF